MLLDELLLLLLELPDNLVIFNLLFIEAGFFLNPVVQRSSERISIMDAIDQYSHKTYLFLGCQSSTVLTRPHPNQLLEHSVHRGSIRTEVLVFMLDFIQQN